MGHPYWPLFDLEVVTPRLTLRVPDDELTLELAECAARGVHPPGAKTPFNLPWNKEASPELERNTFRHVWRNRVEATPEAWSLNLAVVVDGAVVGASGIEAEDFATSKEVTTGSWLGLSHQGLGLGKELRVATLHLGFVGFAAEWARTSAWHDNPQSLGVTRSLGYTAVGHRRRTREGDSDVQLDFEMPRDHFEAHLRRDDIELHGVAGVRSFLAI